MTTCVRPASRADLARLTEIYNHYVIHTPVTFDLEPYTVERRSAWFEQFALTGRYRLMVAEENGIVLGYAGTIRFRVKPAYDTTVETTVYSSPEAVARALAESSMPDYLRPWPARTSIALLAATRCRIMVQRSCMRCSGSRTLASSAKLATSSENIGTCNGQSGR